ncbi:hypothetical protein [Pseudoalteromonas citrea]|nr:hypothetical protein [Pseudoalteromonas citrea]
MQMVTVSNNQFTYQLKPIARGKSTEQEVGSAAQPSSRVNNSLSGIKLAQAFQEHSRSTIYDQPDFKTNVAINTYKEINNQERRADVEALIGVNIYA